MPHHSPRVSPPVEAPPDIRSSTHCKSRAEENEFVSSFSLPVPLISNAGSHAQVPREVGRGEVSERCGQREKSGAQLGAAFQVHVGREAVFKTSQTSEILCEIAQVLRL